MVKELPGRAYFHSPCVSTAGFGVLFALLASPALAEPAWKPLAPGVEFRLGWVNHKPAQLVHLLRFDPAQARLAHLVTTRKQTAGEFLKQSRALAVFNGGYFDRQGSPLGLLFAGRWIQRNAASGSAFGGMFSLIADHPAIHPIFQLSEPDYQALKNHHDLQFLVQCGPRLVADGELVEGLEKNTFVRRTALGYDGQGKVWLLATAPHYGMSFPQLQQYLRHQLGLRWAMNLDGGSSTQCAFRGELENLGFSPLPFALGVFPRKTK